MTQGETGDRAGVAHHDIVSLHLRLLAHQLLTFQLQAAKGIRSFHSQTRVSRPVSPVPAFHPATSASSAHPQPRRFKGPRGCHSQTPGWCCQPWGPKPPAAALPQTLSPPQSPVRAAVPSVSPYTQLRNKPWVVSPL